jgi:dTDP-glucose 4,6-dehydratase
MKNTDHDIVVLDSLTYASSGYDRLRDIDCFDARRVYVFSADLSSGISCGVCREIGNVDYIINLASESHVDRSIDNPVPFVQNNINLTLHLLEWARTMPGLKRFLQFSTDEVYGPAPDDVLYKEGDPHNPGNPYSASKSAQESICAAYANTYGLPVIITNTMNVFGERQHPEKFIPMVISKVLSGEVVSIHANEDKTLPGSRFYIHARNVADAVDFVLENSIETLSKCDAGSGRFNIVGDIEVDNLYLAHEIAMALDKPLHYQMVDFHSARPGHDLRYALDGSKMERMGWKPPVRFRESLRRVVEWTVNHPEWLDA